jgi:hypothetical protein
MIPSSFRMGGFQLIYSYFWIKTLHMFIQRMSLTFEKKITCKLHNSILKAHNSVALKGENLNINRLDY